MALSIADAAATLTAPGQLFEVEEVDIAGRPTRVWKNAPPSLRAILELSRAHGEVPFIVYEDEQLTFAEHYRTSAALAGSLVDRLGVRKGDRVAIAMRNFPEWALAFWAAAAAGAVVVPLNAWWTGAELEYGLGDCGAKVVFCDGERADRLREHWSALPAIETVVVARAQHDLDVDHLPFADAIGPVVDDAELPLVELAPEDEATIFYTSGTTGSPKGAVGTHRNICTNQLSLAYSAAQRALRARSQDPSAGGAGPSAGSGIQNAYLLSVPFFHATGCHSVLVANTMFGGKVVLMYKWDPGRALELIERERVTTFGGVPAMVMQVLDHPAFARRDLSSVRSVGYGGAPAPPDLVRRIKQHFPGGTPSNGYGLTETSSVTTMNSGDDYVRKPDSVGPPVPVCEVKVVDEEGRTLGTGQVGELWIYGPNVVKGYWNKPEETAAAFTDGWLHSGDVARIDDEGFVYIVDRAKDMIIRGGENIYCVEVEAALYEHEAVADAAVFGIPHEVLGEEPGAVVQIRAGTAVTEDELRAFLATRLAAFKVPVRIWFRDEPLPRNPNGKILKRDLKAELVG